MVTLKHLSVKDEGDENNVPLLPEASSSEIPTTQHRRAESMEFIVSRRSNLILSIFLLVSCYSALLVPAYLSNQELIWINGSSMETLALLNHSAAMLSQSCRSGWSVERMRELSTPAGLLKIPVFLKNGTGDWTLPPPLGLLGSEERVSLALRALPHTGLPSGTKTCRRCAVVGSGGVLHGKNLGPHIDQYDIIIRMNNAPVLGFERDAGSRTTIRLMYPEGAPSISEEYKNTEVVALVVFKSLDLAWLTSVVTKDPLSWWSKLWFWRDVIDSIPLQPENFRILNPEIMYRTGQVLQTYSGQQKKMVPTLGISAVVLALQVCDEVSLAGFGYDLQHPGALLHYYESLRMDAMMTQVVHDVSAETILLRELVKAGAVQDLTGAL
ncbi:ST3 beta-galactoside alpha-2,3-sialyltransferase 7 [Triplophysa dalaica]|uniref:ST3 beta-galactoside alpha-2,3-sialyltransferase 7 n=1 Tax=Triplophysa dalaica TaxID=1582913 RepID=UPI0024DFAF8E|nr:ST3 beta-galactoside alpha-2,3-sialyltransferase 7 [Triplophysa dalaica]XP_056617521.1 ST3 beta-galactoside alpha-2,3-sialyltransferase 7 [Triplophysa dalaica]XP_056617522.1 ST3 beta-galactoside alpha-2,3-sialyltransferase 7 [Triplophysa dalaica]